jgi:lipoprotein signal peptidase
MTDAAPVSRAMAAGPPGPVWLFLPAAFLIRLAFSLTTDFWIEDMRQIFLIGLRFYTTGEWPYFGPDVVYTETQIPGALQGLLVGGPLFLVAQPEAPYVLLNLLSFGALSLLAWYIGRRCPDVPRWFLWIWIYSAPWTLGFSTEINNPSYTLTGAVLFFVGVFELVPSLRMGVLPHRLAGAMAGFGLLWVYQLHLSYVLLALILGGTLLLLIRDDRRQAIASVVGCLAGGALGALTVVPTLLKFGPAAVARGTGASVTLDWTHFLRLPEVVARFFSFGSFEAPRFFGAGTEARLIFLAEHWWAAPFVIFATLCGIAQTIVLFAALFRSSAGAVAEARPPTWPAVKRFALAVLALLYVSFAFSVKSPSSHTFYVTLPVVMIYSFYVWQALLARRIIRRLAVALLIAGAVTHFAIAKDRVFERSLYANRPLVVQAIKEKNYRLLGERRPDLWKGER